MKERVVTWLVPRLIYSVYRFLQYSIRWTVVGSEPSAATQPYILSFWHARMLMIPCLFSGQQLYMMISQHRDGGFIADTINLVGIRTVRGSSSRGGARVMLNMIKRVKRERCCLGITPDGPKGPRERVKSGVVGLAVKTNLPVLPVCYATKRQWRAKSWDRFYVPLPFTRGVFVLGDLVDVSPGEDSEQALLRIQKAMDDVQHRADSFFGDPAA